ncbi:FMN-binding protein [Candidatus Aminicenantes bacterium AC-335-K20]|jgi:electron transport complex protein RnfG|nr:FMN-binding protein [SCandidatus Aminicenantes bacterium Aminicenantia_JdfR_composite]MCP2605503.1 FMN-binding protein [Candidatus Aminicenantes bacterium AC-335-O07]MCP2618950.1 FMN-binding protein [Candidatus Aminicenantes bacterium AC-335-A11]MCP2619180.1 FMN-binding protein [Candidatus Aminicenantes bacterium AC-335-K20]MCP2620639.1 FMN-binding protein [Candidatus Aminicenantes bacterium AC-334-E05]
MNIYTRMIIVLTSIGLISGAFLAGVGTLTKNRIALNKQREINEAIMTVVSGAQISSKIYEERDLAVYKVNNEENELLGYAVYAGGVGFQDKIYLMFGVNPEITRIYSLTVLEQKETPGLGAKITSEKDFLQFWKNRDCTKEITLHKPAVNSPEQLSPSEVNIITGATISSEAVVNIVNLALEKIRALKNEGKL